MIIDFHTHAFNPKIAEKAVGNLAKASGIEPYTDGLVETTIKRFDQWGVDKGVLLPIATKPSQQQIINDWAATQKSERIIPFGSIHPDAEDRIDELDRIKSLGLYGVKLHPDYQNYMVDDIKLFEVYEACRDLSLPITLHAGFDCISPNLIHCPPERSKKAFEQVKGMTMILAHLGGNDMWQQVYDILAGMNGNLYFDTSFTMACDNTLMEKIISRHGAERILFASDCPWASAKLIHDKIEMLRISDDAKEKIFSANAVRLLGL